MKVHFCLWHCSTSVSSHGWFMFSQCCLFAWPNSQPFFRECHSELLMVWVVSQNQTQTHNGCWITDLLPLTFLIILSLWVGFMYVLQMRVTWFQMLLGLVWLCILHIIFQENPSVFLYKTCQSWSVIRWIGYCCSSVCCPSFLSFWFLYVVLTDSRCFCSP